MAELDEGIDDLKLNIAFMEAGIRTPDTTYDRRATAGKDANDNIPSPPPLPPVPPVGPVTPPAP